MTSIEVRLIEERDALEAEHREVEGLLKDVERRIAMNEVELQSVRRSLDRLHVVDGATCQPPR